MDYNPPTEPVIIGHSISFVHKDLDIHRFCSIDSLGIDLGEQFSEHVNGICVIVLSHHQMNQSFQGVSQRTCIMIESQWMSRLDIDNVDNGRELWKQNREVFNGVVARTVPYLDGDHDTGTQATTHIHCHQRPH
jgi:hypothetical protein